MGNKILQINIPFETDSFSFTGEKVITKSNEYIESKQNNYKITDNKLVITTTNVIELTNPITDNNSIQILTNIAIDIENKLM